MRKPVIALSVLLAVSTVSIAGASAAPRAYFGLGSGGAGVGYHGWTQRGPGSNHAWWDVNYSALEGAYFLNRRLGLGFRFLDGAFCPEGGGRFTSASFNMAMPTVTWIVCARGQGFDYVRIAVMPYLPDLSSNNPYHQAVSSGFTANYSFVPKPPWPLEARFELGTTVFDWNPDPSAGVTRQIGFHAALGVQIGLAYWLMRKS